MADTLWFLIPELILLTGTVVCAIGGLSKKAAIRRNIGFIACVFLAASCISVPLVYTSEHVVSSDSLMPNLGGYVKFFAALIGILLVMTSGGLMDRKYEHAIASGKDTFDTLRSSAGEYHALLLLSITGLMLICEASDLIWMFLALELVSLPTYVMVAMSRWAKVGQEAAMKYFFLGAISAGLMLYGFAFLYGATGTFEFHAMADVFADQNAAGGISTFGQIGLILALVGLCYKIAAAPMHLYAPDVYQGAASAVTAFLAFVPKAAGFIAIIMLLSLVGWEGGLPKSVEMMLWVVAVLTMILGNIGALLQTSTKRMLGYSSIAHSGYMLIGIIAGPPLGLIAVMVYLVIYGVTNTAAFSTLACLQRNGESVDSLEDISGLVKRSPALAASFAISCGSLLGIPPLFGFWGKLMLFTVGVSAGQLPLVLVAAISSAISAWYYLRLIGLALLAPLTARSEQVSPVLRWPLIATILGAIIAVGGPVILNALTTDASIAIHVSE
ncbi:MAG: NADH-quinone oxidoreductase subunit N [Phycisphaerales bacterium]|jgi:NADH-quinone oxidoreductase subunit N